MTLLILGYGHIAPATSLGKLATIFYTIAGIPLFLLYLSNIGDILATSFKWTYSRICKCQKAPSSKVVAPDARCGNQCNSTLLHLFFCIDFLQHIETPKLQKIIDLPRVQIKDPSPQKHYTLSLPATPSSWSWTLEGLFELTRHPSRAFTLVKYISQKYQDTIRCPSRHGGSRTPFR